MKTIGKSTENNNSIIEVTPEEFRALVCLSDAAKGKTYSSDIHFMEAHRNIPDHIDISGMLNKMINISETFMHLNKLREYLNKLDESYKKEEKEEKEETKWTL